MAIRPEGPQDRWDIPLKRYRQKVPAWSWAKIGLHFSAFAYNTYVATTLSYVAHMAKPAAEALAAETLAGLRLQAKRCIVAPTWRLSTPNIIADMQTILASIHQPWKDFKITD